MQLDVTDVMANVVETRTDGAFQQAGSALSDAMKIFREEIQEKHHRKLEKS
jgi:hypothetical protein